VIEKVAPVELVEESVMVVTPGVGGGVVSVVEGGGGGGVVVDPRQPMRWVDITRSSK